MGESSPFQRPPEELFDRVTEKSPHRAQQIEAVDDALADLIVEQELPVEGEDSELVEAWLDLRGDLLMEIL